MEILINLSGKYAGFAGIDVAGGIFRIVGAPIASTAYAICADGKIAPVNVAMRENAEVLGILVVSGGSSAKIIMQGVARGRRVDMERAKRDLRMIINKSAAPVEKKETPQKNSAALSAILSDAERLFDESGLTKNAPDLSPKKDAKNNPFYSTYPNSTWRKVCVRGRGCYLEGKVTVEGVLLTVRALPASRVMLDNVGKNGYSKVLRDDNGNDYLMKVIRTEFVSP